MGENLRGRKTARRAGVTPAAPPAKATQPSAPSKDQSENTAADDVSRDQHVATLNKLFDDLLAAKDDMTRIQEILSAADKLPISILEGPEGGKFYAAVGDLATHKSRADIRRAALLARRRWRSASFDARQSTESQAEGAGTAQDAEVEGPGAHASSDSVAEVQLPEGPAAGQSTQSTAEPPADEELGAVPRDSATSAPGLPEDSAPEASRAADLAAVEATAKPHVKTLEEELEEIMLDVP